MLVGKINIDVEKLKKNTYSKEMFCAYCDSLVPAEFRHRKEIINNQRYICCLVMRNSKLISWDVKKPLINEVMKGLRITGYTDTLLEVGSLFDYTDVKRVNKFRRN